MLGVERVHLDIDGPRHRAPLPPFHIDVVADAKGSLQHDPIPFSVGPGDNLYLNDDASRRRGYRSPHPGFRMPEFRYC